MAIGQTDLGPGVTVGRRVDQFTECLHCNEERSGPVHQINAGNILPVLAPGKISLKIKKLCADGSQSALIAHEQPVALGWIESLVLTLCSGLVVDEHRAIHLVLRIEPDDIDPSVLH